MDFNLLPCDSRLLAAKMLSYWLSGDQHRLSRELEQMTYLPSQPDSADEDDRVEVLKGLAHRMKTAGDLYAPRAMNPRVGLWIDLLEHFSRPK